MGKIIEVKKIESNKEFCEAMIDSLDKEMAKMLAMIMESTGMRLTELDPDQVRVYNECVRFWDEYKTNMISWAAYQDDLNKKNKIMQQTMTGMIEKNHELLVEILRKVKWDKKGGDRSEA